MTGISFFKSINGQLTTIITDETMKELLEGPLMMAQSVFDQNSNQQGGGTILVRVLKKETGEVSVSAPPTLGALVEVRRVLLESLKESLEIGPDGPFHFSLAASYRRTIQTFADEEVSADDMLPIPGLSSGAE